MVQAQFEGWEEWRGQEASRQREREASSAATIQACWRGYTARKLLGSRRRAGAVRASEELLLGRSAAVIQVGIFTAHAHLYPNCPDNRL